jgi:hypothetical protein
LINFKKNIEYYFIYEKDDKEIIIQHDKEGEYIEINNDKYYFYESTVDSPVEIWSNKTKSLSTYNGYIMNESADIAQDNYNLYKKGNIQQMLIAKFKINPETSF